MMVMKLMRAHMRCQADSKKPIGSHTMFATVEYVEKGLCTNTHTHTYTEQTQT